MQSHGFWSNIKAAKEAAEEMQHLKDEILNTESILSNISEIEELLSLAESDSEISNEIKGSINSIERELQKEEKKLYFSGP